MKGWVQIRANRALKAGLHLSSDHYVCIKKVYDVMITDNYNFKAYLFSLFIIDSLAHPKQNKAWIHQLILRIQVMKALIQFIASKKTEGVLWQYEDTTKSLRYCLLVGCCYFYCCNLYRSN